MKSKTKILISLALLIIFLFSSVFNRRFSKNIITNNNYLEFNEKDQSQIKQSGFWNLTENPIYIDDLATGVGAHNWSWAESQSWCSGSGNWTAPYIIENVTIDGQGSGNCIEIRNSNTYFIIRNCSLYNSGSSSDKSGIKLYNIYNGKLINNNCSDNNYYGIYLRYSNNNTLSGNIASNNNNNGIDLGYSDNNTLSGNTASNSDVSGIFIRDSNNNTLLGNNASNNNHNGIYLNEGDNNTLSGNTASNNEFYGIEIHQSDNNTLSGNTANNNYRGIVLYYSDNNNLSGNTADNNTNGGIQLEVSNNNTLLGNTVSDYTGSILSQGIFLNECNNNTLSGNLMNFGGIYLSGSIVEVASHSIDVTNLVNNKPVYYYANEIALESSNFTGAGYAGQIILINYNNSIISGLNISDGSGINLYYCVNNTLSGNTASNNNFYGIFLYYCINNTISGNTANKNYAGIYLWYSNNNTLSGNTVNNNAGGLVLWGSDNNTLSRNNASNNTYGIVLIYSNNNTALGNNPNNNSYGIYLDSGNNNKIFLNHFINNEINAEDNGINNTWDNGTIGNYWSDYAGVDANHDGIGDTPYLVPGTAGSQDNFPIWTDVDDIAPVITTFFPLPDVIFGLVAPNYNISIDELNLDTIWYTIDGGITNYTITDLTGTFNQTAWEALSEGSLTIRFYANDTAGNIGFIDVEVIIEIPEDLDGVPIISFGNYYILFTFITILSFIILEKQKKK